MRKIFYLFMLMFLLSCGQLPVDTGTAPWDAGIKLLPYTICGKQYVGKGGCAFNESSEDLVIKTPYSGTVSLISANCNYDSTFYYENVKNLSFPIAKLTELMPSDVSTCTFNVKLRPSKFDNTINGDFILFKDKSEKSIVESSFFFNQKVQGKVLPIQIKEGAPNNFDLVVNTVEDSTLYIKGCSYYLEKEIPQGQSTITLKELTGKDEIGKEDECNYSMFFVSKEKMIDAYLISLGVYSNDYIQLGAPTIKYKKGRTCIKYDDPVAIAVLNDKYKLNKGLRTHKLCVDSDYVSVFTSTASGRIYFSIVDKGEEVWRPRIF